MISVKEIEPGLHYWTAPHPAWQGATDWPEDVGCVCYEAPEQVVLIDPLVSKAEEREFWAMLDGWVKERPAAILLTAPWHLRSAPLVAERYGLPIWAHESARGRISYRTHSGDLPQDVELFVPSGVAEGQVAFFLRTPRALVVAEFFLGIDGGLRVLSSPAERDPSAFHCSLETLLDLPIAHVLVAHGEPVIREGQERIAEALRAHG
jgi:glyoxylase-like metal-dependent hydrolase (beta-lactamase superfamily II)